MDMWEEGQELSGFCFMENLKSKANGRFCEMGCRRREEGNGSRSSGGGEGNKKSGVGKVKEMECKKNGAEKGGRQWRERRKWSGSEEKKQAELRSGEGVVGGWRYKNRVGFWCMGNFKIKGRKRLEDRDLI